eukprot:scpid28707/ scgid31064/ Leucine-rich PPR motif-containing protein, mitochondrial; 130 kDa leucine-rich protein; Leucine rich protein 157
MFLRSSCRLLLSKSCIARACSSVGGGDLANSKALPDVKTAYSRVLKDLNAIKASNDTVDLEKFERALRLAAYSPALKSAKERIELVKACTDLAEHRNIDLSVKQHNFILQAYVVAEFPFSCSGYLLSMQQSSVEPNNDTFQLCALAECAAGNVDAVLDLIERMKERSMKVREIVYAGLIESYCRLKRHKEAFQTLDALLASKEVSATATSYMALLRGVTQYAGPRYVSEALSKLRQNSSILLDPDQYRKIIHTAGIVGHLQSLNLLLSNQHVAGSQYVAGGTAPGVVYLLSDFFKARAMRSCHVLLAHLTAASPDSAPKQFGAVSYFVNLVETSGLSFDEQMQVLIEAQKAVPSANIVTTHLTLIVNHESAPPMQISMAIARYLQANVELNCDIMHIIRLKLEASKSIDSVAKWIGSFQQHRMFVPDWLWYALVYTSADTKAPVATVMQLMSKLQMDIFTTACVLKSVDSCSRALPSATDYLAEFRSAVTGIQPALSTPAVQDSTTLQVPAEGVEEAKLKSILDDVDSLVPASDEDAAGLLERSLPSLMLTNVKDAFLLAAHVCDKRPEVAKAVPIACLHSLLTALHDGKLPLHFFRFALSLRSAGVSPPSNWLQLSLAMHSAMGHLNTVDEIFDDLCARSSGNIASLPKSLVLKVFQHWLSSSRASDVLVCYGKLTDPVASDGDLLGLVVQAYVDLGDAENAAFFMEKSMSGKSRPSQQALAGLMEIYQRGNNPDSAWNLWQKVMQAGLTPSAKVVASLAKLLVLNDRHEDMSTLLTQTRVNSPVVQDIVFSAYVAKGHLTSALDFAIAHDLPPASLVPLCAAPFKLPMDELKAFMNSVQNHGSPAFRPLFRQLVLVLSLTRSSDEEVTRLLEQFQMTDKARSQMLKELISASCQVEGTEAVSAVFRLLILSHQLGRPVKQFAESFLDALAKADRRETAIALVRFAADANIQWSLVARLSLDQLGLSAVAGVSSGDRGNVVPTHQPTASSDTASANHHTNTTAV